MSIFKRFPFFCFFPNIFDSEKNVNITCTNTFKRQQIDYPKTKRKTLSLIPANSGFLLMTTNDCNMSFRSYHWDSSVVNCDNMKDTKSFLQNCTHAHTLSAFVNMYVFNWCTFTFSPKTSASSMTSTSHLSILSSIENETNVSTALSWKPWNSSLVFPLFPVTSENENVTHWNDV